MKLRTPASYSGVDCQDATSEARENMLVQPRAKNRTLSRISSLALQHALLDLQHGYGRDVELSRLHTLGPCNDPSVCPALLSLPELRDNVGIQQIHQLRSTGLD